MFFSRRSILSAIGFGIGGVVCIGLSQIHPAATSIYQTLAAVLLGLTVLVVGSGFNDRQRSPALWRLDHFLPFLRRKRLIGGRPHSIVRLAKSLLPDTFFFDPETGKEGYFRKSLRRIGGTFLSAPMRRVSQGLFLGLFLWSFFHVCWPYSARPQTAGEHVANLRFDTIDQQNGNIAFTSGETISIPVAEGATRFLVTQSPFEETPTTLGRFDMVQGDEQSIQLHPVKPLSPEQLTGILTQTEPFSLHETDPNHWPSHHTENLARKEIWPAEFFLTIDPLVSLSTAIASRSWVWSLISAAVILIVCLLIPRGFCGYICPLGTVIDLFDGTIGKGVKRFRVGREGWWVHIKYYLLTSILLAAGMGILISGYFSAIPVITRALLFIGEPTQTAIARGLHLMAPIHAGHWISLTLFAGVLGLGFLRPRFWCKYVCPSGALFSIGNLFRVTERKVESSCIHCDKCVTVCPFDAIKPDFTTRGTDCTLCQTCGGVCPTHAIKFVERWNTWDLKPVNEPPTGETRMGRRGFMSFCGGTALAAIGGIGSATLTKMFGAKLDEASRPHPIRPPGSVPEQEFLQMCIRCGECFKVCPNNVLQPMGFDQGLEGLWTPEAKPDWAGCDPSCNACGQVCPTGAIRALPLEEKKAARMGLAVVNETTCLPFAGQEACQLCVDECNAAGYKAIEFTRAGTQQDENGLLIPDSGFLAPVVLADRCVGCGICQTRCKAINVDQKQLLNQSAIIIEAGPDKEDRLTNGSYIKPRPEQATTPIQNDPFDLPAKGGQDDPFGDLP